VSGWTSAPACAGCGGEARRRRRGVDVGAIVEIPELIQRLADEGKAVVLISSYLPEITALSNRIPASRQGKVVEEFSALEATEEKIMMEATCSQSMQTHCVRYMPIARAAPRVRSSVTPRVNGPRSLITTVTDLPF
jgi:ABC-type multidrug transport system ATPase subunit